MYTETARHWTSHAKIWVGSENFLYSVTWHHVYYWFLFLQDQPHAGLLECQGCRSLFIVACHSIIQLSSIPPSRVNIHFVNVQHIIWHVSMTAAVVNYSHQSPSFLSWILIATAISSALLICSWMFLKSSSPHVLHQTQAVHRHALILEYQFALCGQTPDQSGAYVCHSPW